MKIIKLNTKTKNYINKLLILQRKAQDIYALDILTKINQILFNINECWRAKMLDVNDINDYCKGYKSVINSTCYKF